MKIQLAKRGNLASSKNYTIDRKLKLRHFLFTLSICENKQDADVGNKESLM